MTGTTARGLRVYAEFEDTRGRHVRVQQSSAYGLEHVWIFTSEPDGTQVRHWKAGGGWEPAPRPGAGDPPWREGDPLPIASEGWSSISPHLNVEQCRQLIDGLQQHIQAVEGGDPNAAADGLLDELRLELEPGEPSWLDETDDVEELRDCLRRQRLAAAAERMTHEARAVVAEVHIDPARKHAARIVVGTPTGDRAHEREVGARLLRTAIACVLLTGYERGLVDGLRTLQGQVAAGEIDGAEAWRRIALAMGEGEGRVPADEHEPAVGDEIRIDPPEDRA